MLAYMASAVPLPSVDIYQRLYTPISGTNAVPSTDESLVNQDENPCGAAGTGGNSLPMAATW